MNDEITIEGVSYVSSKRASELSEYAQDYIGQLARGGYIDCQRIGGLWYVSMSSLLQYKEQAEKERPTPPEPKVHKEPESLVFFDGKEFISASRASKLCGYTQDYVGQLARAGKILSRQVGNRWYVDREGILAHKKEKDALLAAVQSQSVGVAPIASISAIKIEKDADQTSTDLHFTYSSESAELLPAIPKESEAEEEISKEEDSAEETHAVPIRILERRAHQEKSLYAYTAEVGTSYTVVGKTEQTKGYKHLVGALSLILGVLVLGGASVWGVASYISLREPDVKTQLGGTSVTGNPYLEIFTGTLEKILAPELFYERK